MGVDTREEIVLYARLLAGDFEGTLSPAGTDAQLQARLYELMEWLNAALDPRYEWAVYSAPAPIQSDIQLASDSGLRLTGSAGDYVMQTTNNNWLEIEALSFEGAVASGASSPTTTETVPLRYLDYGPFIRERDALGTGTAPRYVHWRRPSVAPNSALNGQWQIMVTPSKSLGVGTYWYFSLTGRLAVVDPILAIAALASGATPDLLPHNRFLAARLMAYEHALQIGQPLAWAREILMLVPTQVRAAYLATQKVGGTRVPEGVFDAAR